MGFVPRERRAPPARALQIGARRPGVNPSCAGRLCCRVSEERRAREGCPAIGGGANRSPEPGRISA